MELKVNTETFLKRAYLKHGDLYDYSLVVYKKATEKVKIICKKHGVFEQTPQCHMRGGCKKCSFEKMGKSKRIDVDHFISISTKKHGDKYDYSNVSLTSASDIVEILCKKHGAFKQIANNHMRKSGCYKCNVSENASIDGFKSKAKELHGNRYDYSLAVFNGARNKVDIICKKHGLFKQIASSHLKGSGCKECAKTTSYRRSSYVDLCSKHNGKSNIYLIKCFNDNEVFYKVGITCRAISHRFYGVMPYAYEIIRDISGEAGHIWDCEKKIFSLFKSWSYKPVKKFAGSTECFSSVDVELFDKCVVGELSDVK